MRTLLRCVALLVCAIPMLAGQTAIGQDTKIVLIAGKPSHKSGDHEFNAGTKLLVKRLKEIKGIDPVFVAGGWPEDESVFEGAKAVVFYMDGGSAHPMIQGNRLATMQKLMDKGVGLVCLHYAVEFPKEVSDKIIPWLGGYYETGYSTNPDSDATVTPAEGHRITRGVKPFQILDEWYYRIRFKDGDTRVKPILTATHLKDNPNPDTVAWATERENGGRSFGFTGGHYHKNWANNDFRRLILNAILWSAKVRVPREGVVSSDVPDAELALNLDKK